MYVGYLNIKPRGRDKCMGALFVFKNLDIFADKKQRVSIRIRQSLALFYFLILTLTF